MDMCVDKEVFKQLLRFWIGIVIKSKSNHKTNDYETKTNQHMEISIKWNQYKLFKIKSKNIYKPYPRTNFTNKVQMSHCDFLWEEGCFLTIPATYHCFKDITSMLNRSKGILFLQASSFLRHVEIYYYCLAVHSYLSLVAIQIFLREEMTQSNHLWKISGKKEKKLEVPKLPFWEC
jgi:hypothetical protein